MTEDPSGMTRFGVPEYSRLDLFRKPEKVLI
jgi:hypothetical protein